MKQEAKRHESTQAASPYQVRQGSLNDSVEPFLGEDAHYADETEQRIADQGYRTSHFAQDVNQLKPQQSSCHCQAFIATLFFIGGITTALILFLKPDPEITVQALIGICAGSYVFYLIVGCCCNKLNSYLSNIDKGQHFEQYYDSVREKPGRFRFDAECYHYQTQFHTRTYTDSDGNTQTQTYTTQEKVVTHTATQYLDPVKMVDQSGLIDQIRAVTPVVFIRFAVHYKFVDKQSQRKFDDFYTKFKIRNTYDTYQNFGYKYEVPGLVERKAFYVGQLQCEYGGWFYFCGMFCLLWPYSLWVESKISRFVVDYLKILTL